MFSSDGSAVPKANPRLPEGIRRLRKQRPMLGRHCGLATLCTACHPDGLHPGDRDDCHGFAAVDVAECNVGQSCDGCGKPLLAGQAVA